MLSGKRERKKRRVMNELIEREETKRQYVCDGQMHESNNPLSVLVSIFVFVLVENQRQYRYQIDG